jgi:hypothetical protein
LRQAEGKALVVRELVEQIPLAQRAVMMPLGELELVVMQLELAVMELQPEVLLLLGTTLLLVPVRVLQLLAELHQAAGRSW